MAAYDDDAWTYQRTLVNLSQTCSRLRSLVGPYAWHTLHLSHDRYGRERTPGARVWRGKLTDMFEYVFASDWTMVDGKKGTKKGVKGHTRNTDNVLSRSTPFYSFGALSYVRHVALDLSGVPAPKNPKWLLRILRYPALEHLEITVDCSHRQTQDQAYGKEKEVLYQHGLEFPVPAMKKLSFVFRPKLKAGHHIGSYVLGDMHIQEALMDHCPRLQELCVHGAGGVKIKSPHLGRIRTMRLVNCRLSFADLRYLLTQGEILETFIFARGNVREDRIMSEQQNTHYSSTEQFTPWQAVLLLWPHRNTLKHLELKPFSNWERHSQARNDWPLMREEKVDLLVQSPVIKTLRHFTNLKALHLCQDAILGPCPWSINRGRNAGTVINILNDDPEGERLVEVLPSGLEDLRITGVSQDLAPSLLRFARDAEGFPRLRKVYLHGENPHAELLRHMTGTKYLANERYLSPAWQDVERDVLVTLGRIFKQWGVEFEFEAMGSVEGS
ncbi:hypothetical protein CGCSCA4_v001649 [Colletotrichum siamense]|uniref:Uncharacterized protein n=1 Tax=Colletotrichum siamense TaxID=690259 RepID=A0A9P5F1Y4_COLSI|nr:hypothetical protein CGCSCA4_v001649 [Colletotrichum siamense]KAF4864672.1 hypothetical protein CGCSCA2_v001785 [Colletotrichum siamense]